MARVERLTWDEVEQAILAGCDGLLPIAAASKEHGLHLPMNADAIQAEWLAAELDRRFQLLVWPTVTYGYYPAFREFPGSISLALETFTALVGDIAKDILRHGVGKLFILDTGISTIKPIDELIDRRFAGGQVIHLRIHDGPRYRAVAAQVQSQAFGSHADELETSRMLAIAPELVCMDRAQATPSGPFGGRLTRANAPSGSSGDPRPASAEKGRKLLDAMLADLSETMED